MFLPTDLKVCHFHYFLYTWKPHWHQWIYHMLGDEYLKQIFWHDRPYALNLRGPLDSKIVWANAIQVKIKLKPFKSSLNSFFSTSFLWRICSCWSFFVKSWPISLQSFFFSPWKFVHFQTDGLIKIGGLKQHSAEKSAFTATCVSLERCIFWL